MTELSRRWSKFRGQKHTNTDSPNRLNRQGNLANALRDRFEKTNTVSDIDEAIAVYRQILRATSPEEFIWSQTQANLGEAFRIRYEALRQMGDLEAAIEAFYLSLPPDNNSYQKKYLNGKLGLMRA